MTFRVAVVVFPGSNCEHDVVRALESLGASAELAWHAERSLPDVDAVVLPGGFAHGDYLRPGALARFSPVMAAVEELAGSGGVVLGICNGFQVLTEAGLLPGAFQRNAGLKFLCTSTAVQVESTKSALTSRLSRGDVLSIPINHFSGNYTCDNSTLERLRAEDQVILRYLDNPNGSTDDIAGIAVGNVIGLMPHPERAVDPLTGAMDGARLLESLLAPTSLAAGKA